jgi:FkbM family methyltransferase
MSNASMELINHEKELVWEFFGRKREGFFVEVGANDPRHGSQTWLLEENGWRGVLVEPQTAFYERLVRERPRSKVHHAACSAPESRGTATLHIANLPGFSTLEKQPDTHGVTFVETESVRVTTLDDVLEAEGNPSVDFVSVDVEGQELNVLRGFSIARHRPKLLLIEDNVRNLDKHRYLQARGYRLVKRTTLNNWYVPEDAVFTMHTAMERLALFRKMYLATPLRQWRLARRRRKGVK